LRRLCALVGGGGGLLWGVASGDGGGVRVEGLFWLGMT